MNLDGPRVLGYSPRIPIREKGSGVILPGGVGGGPCPYGLVPRRGWSGPSWRFLMDEKARGPGSVEGPGTDRLRVAKLRSRHLPLAASFIPPPPTHTPRASAGFSSVGDAQLKPSGIPDSGPLDSGRPGHPRVQEPRKGRPELQGEWGGLGVPTSLRLISFLYLRLVASVASTAGGTNSVGGECNCN